MIEILIVWILITLGVVTFSAILARIYSVEIVIGVFASLTVVANIIAFKLVNFGPFVVPSAVIAYASTFLITDIVSEFFGKKEARKAVWAGFIANIVMVIVVSMAVQWPAAPFVDQKAVEAFNTVMGFAPRVVLASMVAFLLSQHHDVWAFHFWKRMTGGKHLWLRNNASTMVSQLFDTVIFISLAFYGIMPGNVILQLIIGQYVIKLLIAILDTPFIYIAIKLAGIVSSRTQVAPE